MGRGGKLLGIPTGRSGSWAHGWETHMWSRRFEKGGLGGKDLLKHLWAPWGNRQLGSFQEGPEVEGALKGH